jgi:histidine triad (HIT) family protein
MSNCLFCSIVAKTEGAEIVHEDADTLAFLDIRPLFAGHTLVVPKRHLVTIGDLPETLVQPFFASVQMLAVAVETAMEAKGTFVAMNNKVSQSVAHLHVHVVPRRPKDGLRGFFWPRSRYESEQEMTAAGNRIRSALEGL